METMLAEPASVYLKYVNDRNVKALGPVLLPHLAALGADPSLSPDRAQTSPGAPVFLLHGADDTVIPAAESVVLSDYLTRKGTSVRVLLSRLITHAEVDKSAAATETWKLVLFWADLLQR
jgi:predicted esterase